MNDATRIASWPAGYTYTDALGRLTVIARAVYNIDSAYQAVIHRITTPNWDTAPDVLRQAVIDTVQALISNPGMTPAQLYRQQAAIIGRAAWVYGSAICEFDMLPSAQVARLCSIVTSVLELAHITAPPN
jgi:hypothetical protein